MAAAARAAGQPYLLRVTYWPWGRNRCGWRNIVFIHFVVRLDGLLGDIRVQQGVTPALDAAAMQVIRDLHSKRWQLGFQNRRVVAVSYTLPITFAIR